MKYKVRGRNESNVCCLGQITEEFIFDLNIILGFLYDFKIYLCRIKGLG